GQVTSRRVVSVFTNPHTLPGTHPPTSSPPVRHHQRQRERRRERHEWGDRILLCEPVLVWLLTGVVDGGGPGPRCSQGHEPHTAVEPAQSSTVTGAFETCEDPRPLQEPPRADHQPTRGELVEPGRR